MPRVIPMLSYEDVAQAAEWLAEAFGLLETGRWADTDGRVTHVNMELGDGMVMLGSPSPQYQSPRHHTEVCDLARAWSTTPYIVDGVFGYVDDIDAHSSRRRPAGRRSSPHSRTISRSGSAATGPRMSKVIAGCSLSRSDRSALLPSVFGRLAFGQSSEALASRFLLGIARPPEVL
jgi:uncharacterized glyoxalase superfamily protein PhnB